VTKRDAALAERPPRAATRHGERTREKLIIAALETINEGGYAVASVGAITQRAGVAAGTLYSHFGSKEELFIEMFRTAGDEILAAMEHSAIGQGGFLDRLQPVIRTYVGQAIHNRRLVWALVYEPVDPLVDAERLAYRRKYSERLAAALQIGITAGEIPDQDTALTAAALVGAIAEALVGPLSPVMATTSSGDELVTSLLTFCRQAIGAPAPPAPRARSHRRPSARRS
jgi:AcrR family transcriptional regulator